MRACVRRDRELTLAHLQVDATVRVKSLVTSILFQTRLNCRTCQVLMLRNPSAAKNLLWSSVVSPCTLSLRADGSQFIPRTDGRTDGRTSEDIKMRKRFVEDVSAFYSAAPSSFSCGRPSVVRCMRRQGHPLPSVRPSVPPSSCPSVSVLPFKSTVCSPPS